MSIKGESKRMEMFLMEQEIMPNPNSTSEQQRKHALHTLEKILCQWSSSLSSASDNNNNDQNQQQQQQQQQQRIDGINHEVRNNKDNDPLLKTLLTCSSQSMMCDWNFFS